MLFKNIIFTHSSDYKVIAAVRFFLGKLYPGGIPNNIHLFEDIEYAISVALTMTDDKVLLICSGKSHFNKKEMMAGELADTLKERMPNISVVAYSNSEIHKDSDKHGSLYGYIDRGLSTRIIQKSREYLSIDERKLCTDNIHDLRAAEILKFASEATSIEDFNKLFFSEDSDAVFKEALIK